MWYNDLLLVWGHQSPLVLEKEIFCFIAVVYEKLLKKKKEAKLEKEKHKLAPGLL